VRNFSSISNNNKKLLFMFIIIYYIHIYIYIENTAESSYLFMFRNWLYDSDPYNTNTILFLSLLFFNNIIINNNKLKKILIANKLFYTWDCKLHYMITKIMWKTSIFCFDAKATIKQERISIINEYTIHVHILYN